jgi:hypothetical protein
MVPEVPDQGVYGRGLELSRRCRSESRADFIAKLTTAEEEADETAYWLELLAALDAVPIERARPLLREASELTAIFVSSVKTDGQEKPCMNSTHRIRSVFTPS